MKTAILIDGGFFYRRYSKVKGFDSGDSPLEMARNISRYCMKHIKRINKYRIRHNLNPTELHRIYYYDASPFEGDSHNPVSNKSISFKNTHQYKFRHGLFNELRKQRKIALRLGFLKNSSKDWIINPKYTKKLLSGKISLKDLKSDDVTYPLQQKAVDIKIGLDIATLSFKNQVDQILLITGDSDFVPVAKFARKEGVDFILDPMGNPIDASLYEHIDGLYSVKNIDDKPEDE